MKFAKPAVLALSFVVIYNLFFFQTNPGLGTGFFFLLLNIYFFLIRNKESQNLAYAVFSSVTATIFAFLLTFRSNEIVQFINLIFAFLFSSVALFFYKYEQRFSLFLPSFLLAPLSLAAQVLSSTLNFLAAKEDEEKTKNPLTAVIIKSSVVSLILIIILFWLLSSGDLIFGTLVNNLLKNIWERIIISVVIFTGLFIFGISSVKNYLTILEKEAVLKLGKVHELTIILGSIIALFTFFIFVQFRYLFIPIGEAQLREIGINSATYSEYVRAGFSELLVAATVVFFVIVYVSRFTHKLTGNQKSLIQLLAVILTFENGLILISATKRLFLYVSAHGLTRAREFGLIFLIWLAVILIITLISIMNKVRRELLTKIVLGITLIALFSTSFINLDGIITTRYQPTVNEEIDYHYLMSLSEDAYQAWVPAIIDADIQLANLNNKTDLSADDYRKFVLTRLSIERLNLSHIKYLENKYNPVKSWQSFNLSEYLAYQHIRDKSEIFGRIPTLLNQAGVIDQRFSEQTKRDARLDRGITAPLTP